MKLFQKQDEQSRSPNGSHKQFQYFYSSSTKPFTGEACFRTKKPDQDNDESVFFVVIIRVMSAEDIRTFNQDEKS